jgi:hypothetical protein
VWRDGRVVWLAPDQIPIASDDSSQSTGERTSE